MCRRSQPNWLSMATASTVVDGSREGREQAHRVDLCDTPLRFFGPLRVLLALSREDSRSDRAEPIEPNARRQNLAEQASSNF